MPDLPDGAELLRVARETLLNELLPHLPKDLHYPALMVANAMAIAAREAQAGAGQEDAETALFTALYGPAVAGSADGHAALTRQFAEDLRAGRFDARLGEVGGLLLAVVRERLRLSNPKLLPAAGR